MILFNDHRLCFYFFKYSQFILFFYRFTLQLSKHYLVKNFIDPFWSALRFSSFYPRDNRDSPGSLHSFKVVRYSQISSSFY